MTSAATAAAASASQGSMWTSGKLSARFGLCSGVLSVGQAVLREGASLQVQRKMKPSRCGALTSR